MSLEISHIYSYNKLDKISVENKNSVLFYGENLDNRSDEVFCHYSKIISDKYKIIYDENKFELIINDDMKIRNHLFGERFIKEGLQRYY